MPRLSYYYAERWVLSNRGGALPPAGGRVERLRSSKTVAHSGKGLRRACGRAWRTLAACPASLARSDAAAGNPATTEEEGRGREVGRPGCGGLRFARVSVHDVRKFGPLRKVVSSLLPKAQCPPVPTARYRLLARANVGRLGRSFNGSSWRRRISPTGWLLSPLETPWYDPTRLADGLADSVTWTGSRDRVRACARAPWSFNPPPTWNLAILLPQVTASCNADESWRRQVLGVRYRETSAPHVTGAW